MITFTLRRVAVSLVALTAGCTAFGSSSGPGGVADTVPDASTDAYGPTEDASDQADARSGDGAAIVFVDAGPAVVFVTSAAFTGAQVSDKACADAVQKTPLEGRRFRAWIADQDGAPADKLSNFGPWYVMTDGELLLVASTLSELAGNSLKNPIDIDQNGNKVGLVTVWTGTTGTGTVGWSCNNWTIADQSPGSCGLSTSIDVHWAADNQYTCENHFHVYCFEQPP
jgi:hypothetical protein